MRIRKELVSDFLLILLGNFILAFAVSFFIIPYDILTGGIFGVAIALKPILLNIDTNFIAYFMIALTFLLGAVFLGRNFAFKTVVSSVVYPIFLEIMRHINFAIDTEPILAALYGGILSGVAIGIVFKAQASTGGMDVFPLLLHKYFDIIPSTGLLIVDSITVLLGIYTLGIDYVLIGLISVFAASFTIDKMILFGSETSKSTLIISDAMAIINKRIQLELDRGTTIIKAVGGYSEKERDILMCVITKEQYPLLKEIVYAEDENAFLIVQEAHEILGEGFNMGHRV